jgi:hypothetical protein
LLGVRVDASERHLSDGRAAGLLVGREEAEDGRGEVLALFGQAARGGV